MLLKRGLVRPANAGSGGLRLEVLAWFFHGMTPMMLALEHAVEHEKMTKLIESDAHRWKTHHNHLMQKKAPKWPYLLKITDASQRSDAPPLS